MYSQEKIKWMTQAAVYEQSKNRQDLHAHKFCRGDYLSFYLFKILLCVTLAYGILVGAVALYLIEAKLELVNQYPLRFWLFSILILYLVVLLVYAMITIVVYSIRYDRAERFAKRYVQLLKGISRMNSEGLQNTMGGSGSHDKLVGSERTPEDNL